MKKNKKVGKMNKESDKLIRVFGTMIKDEYGEVLYTFYDKKKADEFYNILKNDQ